MDKQGYILRYYLPIKPHFDEAYTERRFAQLLDFCRRTATEAVMLYVALDPNWYYISDTVAYARQARDQMLPYIARLREAGISYQLNFQNLVGATLGGVDFSSVFGWENLVDHKGREALGCGCPIGEKFRAQAGERLRIWAETYPDVIWIDDDLRYHNHGTPVFSAREGKGGYADYYCFCDEHLARFNQKHGTSYDREGLIADILAPGEPSRARSNYLDFLGETIAETADWIRRTVQDISPKTRIAQMTSLPDVHAAEGRNWGDFLSALSGEYPPMIRAHFGPYQEGNPRAFTECYRALAQTVRQVEATYYGKVEYCPEVENTRFTVWAKSAAATAYQLRLSAFMGCRDITLSLYDLDGGSLEDEPAYERMLIEQKPALDKLVGLSLGDAGEEGVIIPLCKDSGKRYRTGAGDSYDVIGGRRRYIENYLLRMGVPCRYLQPENIKEGIVALDAFTAGFLSDAELSDILSRRTILDAGAAKTLIERGFADKIGVTELKKQSIYVNAEIFRGYAREDGTYVRVPSRIPWGAWFAPTLVQGTQVLSDFLTPDGNTYPALSLYENELGGKVLFYPAMNDFGDGFFTHRRVRAWKDILSSLDPTLPRVDCDCYTLTVVKRTAAGERYYFVANLSADRVEKIEINGKEIPCSLQLYESIICVERDGQILPLA